MQLNTTKFALAGAGAGGALYALCGVLVFLFPDFALQSLGWIAHLVNVEKFAGDVQLTLTGFLLGLAQIIVYSFVASWVFAWIYNSLLKKES